MLFAKYGTNFNLVSPVNKSNLHHLLSKTYFNISPQAEAKIAEILLYHGLSVDATDAFGWTPMMYASESGKIELIDILIKYGADVNKVNF